MRTTEAAARPEGYEERPAAEPDWRAAAEEAIPLLEWAATHAGMVGRERADEARRLIVRHYIRSVDHPRLARARPRP